jgi:hypothetical protein
MKHASVFQAIKFGFDLLIKRPFFFLGTYIIAAGVGILGVIASFILALPFLKPLINMLDKLKIQLMGSFGQSLSDAAQAISATSQKQPGMLLTQIKLIVVQISRGILVFLWENPTVWLLLAISLFILVFVVLGVQFYIYAGWARISLEFYDKGSSKISSLFSSFGMLLKLMCVGCIYTFLTLLPLKIAILLTLIYPSTWFVVLMFITAIVCGNFLLLKLFYAYFYAIEPNTGIFECFGKAYRLKGSACKLLLLFVLYGVTLGIMQWLFGYLPIVLSSLLFFLAYIAIHSIVFMSLGFLYRRLAVR